MISTLATRCAELVRRASEIDEEGDPVEGDRHVDAVLESGGAEQDVLATGKAGNMTRKKQ